MRKLSFGVGVERTFPVHSPKIERIEVVGRGEVRRAKLYYLRGRVGRRARLREMRDFRPENVGDGRARRPPTERRRRRSRGRRADAEAASRRGATPRPSAGSEEPAAEEPAAEEPAAEEDAAPPRGRARSREAEAAGADEADEEQAPAEGDKQGQSA